MELLDRVRRTIRRHDLAAPDVAVVAGVSGGSDSVALAHLLKALADAGDLRLVGLAHFNHLIRPEADADEAFCAALAASLSCPFLADREDVPARARRDRRSLEDAGRTARYAFFDRARQHFAAGVVALGHTRDDQAETFLLRLLRGAGARGLASMHPKHGAVVRPLLDCRRTDLRRFLDARQALWVHDASNDDVTIPRNRVRSELLPLIEARFNPSVVDALADAADVAREEWQWLEASAEAHWARLCRREGRVWRIDAAGLHGLPTALARLVLRRAMTEASGGRPVGFAHVDEALHVSQDGGGPIDLPGHRVQRLGPDVVLTGETSGGGRADEPAVPGPQSFRHELRVPGETAIPEAGWVVIAQPAPSFEAAGVGSDREAMRAVVQLAPDSGKLVVRGWRAGDWFRPLGVGGRKKLQDYFVDRKVPRGARLRVPLVVDEFDRIVWVAGHAIGEEFRVTDPAQPVLVLRLKPLGGPA